MARYVMTARRKAALRKAQLASARRRKGISRRRVAGVLGTVAVGYLVGREVTGTNTYRKNKAKVKNITKRKRVGYKTVKVSRKEYRFIKYADAMDAGYDNPAFNIGIDRKVRKPIYRRQFRTRQNRKEVFKSLDSLWVGRGRSTFSSRREYRKAKKFARSKEFWG